MLSGTASALRRWEADLGTAPPGGESLTEVQARVLDLVGELAREHRGEWIALVSHVGPIKALLCAALGAPLATARHLFLDPGTLSVVDWGERPVAPPVQRPRPPRLGGGPLDDV